MTKEEEMIEAVDASVPDTVQDKVRNLFLHKGYNGILILGRLFRRADNDGSGTLQMDEIKQLLTEEGLELTDEEYSELLADYDSDGSGAYNYEEFISSIRPPMSDARIEVVKQAFDKLDESKNGVVTIDDIRDKYNSSNHPSVLDGSETEDQVLTRYLARYEGNTTTDGTVTLNEFTDYYSGVSKSIDDDEYFVEMMKLAWGL